MANVYWLKFPSADRVIGIVSNSSNSLYYTGLLSPWLVALPAGFASVGILPLRIRTPCYAFSVEGWTVIRDGNHFLTGKYFNASFPLETAWLEGVRMFFLNPVFQLIELVFQLLFWGAIILVAVVVIRAMMGGGPREDEVAERWSALLPGQVKAAQEFFDLVEAELDARDSPYNETSVELGAGLTSSGQPAIRVIHNHIYSCYICLEQVGKDLHVTWALHEKTSWLYSIPVIGPILYRWWSVVSIPDRNKLLAFGAFTKSSVENVVDSMMDKYNLDKTKLVRQSSGMELTHFR